MCPITNHNFKNIYVEAELCDKCISSKKKGTQIDTVFARYTGSMIYGFHLANTKSFSQVTASSPTVCEG